MKKSRKSTRPRSSKPQSKASSLRSHAEKASQKESKWQKFLHRHSVVNPKNENS